MGALQNASMHFDGPDKTLPSPSSLWLRRECPRFGAACSILVLAPGCGAKPRKKKNSLSSAWIVVVRAVDYVLQVLLDARHGFL
jgi:hypothetical protein